MGRYKFAAIWLLTLALNGSAVAYLVKQNNSSSEQNQWITHTYESMGCIESIFTASIRAESNIRAYALSRDEKYVQDREAAASRCFKSIDRFKQLTSDNPTQSAYADQLIALSKQRYDLGSDFIHRARAQGLTDAQQLTFVKASSSLTRQIEQLIHQMRQTEDNLLVIRRQGFDGTIRSTNNILFLLAFFGLVTLVAAAITTYRLYIARKNSEKLVRGVFDNSYQFMGILSPHGEIIEVNNAALSFIEGEPSNLKGRHFADTPWWMHAPQEQKKVDEALKRAADGEFVRFETTHKSPNGTEIDIDFTLTPILDDNGDVIYLLPEGRDVTMQKKAHQLIEASESRLRAVLASLAEGLIQIDTEGNFTYVNATAERLLLYKQDELLNKEMHALIHSQSPEGVPRSKSDCPLFRVVRTGMVSRVSEDWFQRKDGSFLPVEYVSSPLVQDGQVIGAVIAFQDIRLRKEAENRVSEFYSSVSHELRTPLTSIRGALRLLEGGKGGQLSDRGKHLIGMARQECDRLVRLINDILDIRKIEAGKLELKKESFDLQAMIGEVLSHLSHMAGEGRVTLDSEINLSENIEADRDRLTQILTNLVSNAIKFSPPDSRVMLKAYPIKTFIRFEIIDQGPGISQENQKKLFRSFQQVDSTDAKPKGGTGLGLAISKALVEQHQGQIGLESTVGEGSTFWFTLPRDPNARAVVQTQESASDGPTTVARQELLIIDQSQEITDLLTRTMHDLFVIKRVGTCKEAIELMQSNSCLPRAILLDLGQSDDERKDFLEIVAADPRFENIPVLLTGNSTDSHGSFLHPMIVEFLVKPSNETALIAAIERAIKGKAKPAAHALIIEDDEFTRELLGQQLARLGIKAYKSATGEEGIKIASEHKIDLLVLDLGLPFMSGTEVIESLKSANKGEIPLLVYTARDLNASQRAALTLGATKHLTKSVASEEQFVCAVKEMLKGIIDNASALPDAGTQF